jgi:hypothetical protein
MRLKSQARCKSLILHEYYININPERINMRKRSVDAVVRPVVTLHIIIFQKNFKLKRKNYNRKQNKINFICN